MNDKKRELALFNLCKSLVSLLGEKEALADLTLLYERHPEMFKNENEVGEVVEKVVSEPDYIKINPKAKSDKDFMVAKILDDEKMADVGIRNDKGMNIIFHTNKKNISQIKRFKNEAQMLVETPSTEVAPTRSDHCADKSSDLSRDIKILSTPVDKTISNPPLESQILSEEEKLFDEMLKTQKKINDMPRVKDFAKDFEKDLEKSFNVETCDENLQKIDESKYKQKHKKPF